MAKSQDVETPLSIAGTEGYAKLGPDPAAQVNYRDIAAGTIPRKVIGNFQIPARSGLAFRVGQGQVLRVCCESGPQVADFIVFNDQDPAERFWAARTRVIHGAHLSVGHQLWSTPPWTRPMMTIIADTLDQRDHPHGAASHDLLFCRCDGRHYEIVHERTGAANCQDNLANAIADFGLRAEAVHDPFNIFMTTGLNEDGRPFYLPSDAKRGDFLELVAEIDCLVAISACPGGSSGSQSHALGVTMYAVG